MKHTKEALEKMSRAHKGIKRGPCSDETKRKISEANKGNGKPWSPARREAYERSKLKVAQ
jgi:hypothetical protein